jgi:hypothetical protein
MNGTKIPAKRKGHFIPKGITANPISLSFFFLGLQPVCRQRQAQNH